MFGHLWNCAICLAVLVPVCPAIDLPFDAAYMVSSAGSTTAVTEFASDGPAPWLYLDLPDGALYSFSAWATTDWFLEPSATKALTSTNAVYADPAHYDRLWVAPSPSDWATKGAVGEWHINARHSLVELVMIYGVGAPRVWATGSTRVDFAVVAPLAGDFNEDGWVDHDDLMVWKAEFGAADPAAMLADANSDGAVDTADYTVWRDAMAAAASRLNAQGVPEPAALWLAGTLLATFGYRAARRAD